MSHVGKSQVSDFVMFTECRENVPKDSHWDWCIYLHETYETLLNYPNVGKQTMHSMPGYGEFFLPSFLSRKKCPSMTGRCLRDCLLVGLQFLHHLGPLPGRETSGMGAPKSMWCIWPVVVGGTWWIWWFWNAVSTVEGKRLAPWWPKWRHIIEKHEGFWWVKMTPVVLNESFGDNPVV